MEAAARSFVFDCDGGALKTDAAAAAAAAAAAGANGTAQQAQVTVDGTQQHEAGPGTPQPTAG
jgi:hypothetical protein